MDNPLVMLGPGGDYQVQYRAAGTRLQRSIGATLGQQPDTETAGSFAGFEQGGARDGRGGLPGELSEPPQRRADRFEHQSPQPGAGVYRPGCGGAVVLAMGAHWQLAASAFVCDVTCERVTSITSSRHDQSGAVGQRRIEPAHRAGRRAGRRGGHNGESP